MANNRILNYEATRHRRKRKRRSSLRVFDDNRRQVISILRWFKQRCAIRLGRTPFDQLVTATDYESMMLSFVTRLSDSQVNKHRQRFWEIVRFARRDPHGIRLPFGHEDVRKFGGTELRKRRSIPTVEMIQQILKASTARERLWIWMGLAESASPEDHNGGWKRGRRRGSAELESAAQEDDLSAFGVTVPPLSVGLAGNQADDGRTNERLFVRLTDHALNVRYCKDFISRDVAHRAALFRKLMYPKEGARDEFVSDPIPPITESRKL